MGKWDMIKQAIGIPSDEDELLDGAEGMNDEAIADPVREKATLRKETTSGRSATAPMAAKGQVNMVIIRSFDYSDARTVADHILANRAVLLNLENCNKEMAQRILDFLSGVVYAQGGDLQKVAHSTYAVTPRNVGLQGELSEEIKEEF